MILPTGFLFLPFRVFPVFFPLLFSNIRIRFADGFILWAGTKKRQPKRNQ